MSKILFVHSSSEMYGSDKSLLLLIKEVVKRHVVFVMIPENGPLVNELERVGAEVIVKNFPVLRRKNLKPKYLFNFILNCIVGILKLSKFYLSNNFEIVYLNTSVLLIPGIAAKKSKVKVIWHIREIIKSDIENTIVKKIILKCSDRIIANSKATLARMDNPKNGIVVHNGIENTTEVFLRNYDKEKIKIGMAGRINRWKGQNLFVDAASKVISRGYDVDFVIAGDVYPGDEKIKLELMEKIVNRGLQERIHLIGQCNDMASFYKEIDVFVLPSTQPEPFGLVVIEAMQYGLPVIATNHGGPVEIIDNKINGLLFDYTDENELVSSICNLLDSLEFRENLGKKAKEKQQLNFSIDSTTKRILEVIENV